MEHHKTSPLAMYDLTVPCDRYTREQITDFMRTYCKRWCFQQESGAESGYVHYQCRISLISKKRLSNMITFMTGLLPGVHVSPSSNPTYFAGNEFYVMKIDTRLNGPWTDRDDINPNMIPKRFRNEPTWKPWQQTVISKIEEEADDRTINVIIDAAGNTGKTFLTLYLTCHNRALRVPQQKEAKDIMRMVMDAEKRTCYFIDLPRGTSHKDQNSVYAAIEEIKNGYCYDDRYHFKQCIFDPPHIWVFTNQIPPQNLLSKDRWRYWQIINGSLSPYSASRVSLSLNILSGF